MSDFKGKAKSLVLDHEKFRDLSTSLVAAMADSIFQSRLHQQNSIDPNTQSRKKLTRPCSLSMEPNISILKQPENIFQVKQVHAPVTTSGMLHTSFAANMLLYAYTRHKDLAHACLLFDRMGEKNLISWNIMIGGFAKVGDFMQCLWTFRELIRCGEQPDSYTLPFVIKSCRDSTGINMGRLTHCYVVKCGLHLNQFVCAALINMYAKCGFIETAKQLFDKMPSKDLVTWTVMICAYAECGSADESLALFDRLRDEGFVPDHFTVVAVVNACAKLGALSKARLVHDYITANKFSFDEILGTALIDMYAKCGSADSARAVFDKMQKKNVITWSAMISAYGNLGEGKKGLELFSMMLSSGILPNKVTFVSLLYACSQAGLVEEGLQLFSSMFESYGMRPEIEHYTCMVDLLGQAGRLDEALKVIENMAVEKDDGFWSTLLRAFENPKSNDIVEKAAKSLLELEPQNPSCYVLLSNIYANADRWKETAEIRDLMTKPKLKKISGHTWIEVDNVMTKFSAGIHQQNSVGPNTQSRKKLARPFSLSMEPNISILTLSKNIFQVKQVHAPVTTSGMLHTSFAANRLLYAYMCHKDLAHACLLFDRMGEKNLISWNIMIGGFAKVGDFILCLGTFRELIRCGGQPDSYTLPAVIKACRDSTGIDVGRLIHCYVMKCGLHLNRFVCAALVGMYAKCGFIEIAKQLFDKMASKDLVTWSVMIGAYAECGNANESLALFDRLREEGIVPDHFTVVAVVKACAKLGALSKARLLYDYISANKFPLDEILGMALIDMYAKCGSADSAREIFDKMQNKNVTTWTAMITAYGYVGEAKKALKLFYMMQTSGVLPNKITFLSLLHVCSTAGLVEEGLRLFSLMSGSYGLSPDIQHYTCVVNLFGRAGRLDEASRFIENMMVEKDNGFWSTLLQAFKNHKSNDMAEKAAKSLLESQTLKPGHYIRLSNFYAEAGRMKQMAKIGDLRLKRKLMRIPGHSSIEVDNIVYEFSTGGTAHPRAEEINGTLKALTEKLELAGNVPDRNLVFHDVDEE